jgi:ribosomal protein L29
LNKNTILTLALMTSTQLFVMTSAHADEFFSDCVWNSKTARYHSMGKGNTLGAAEADAASRIYTQCSNLPNTTEIKNCKRDLTSFKAIECEKVDEKSTANWKQIIAKGISKNEFAEMVPDRQRDISNAKEKLAELEKIRLAKSLAKPAPDLETQVAELKKENTRLKAQLSACKNSPSAHGAVSTLQDKDGKPVVNSSGVEQTTGVNKGN